MLTHGEIRVLWNVLKTVDEPIASLYRIFILTGQRSQETRLVEWAHFADDYWEIPAANTKNDRTHRLPLSPQVLEILENLTATTGQSRYVFETPSPRSKGPIKWLSHATAKIRNVCGFHFTPHDLRRTAASGMAALGVSRVTLARILNHKSADSTVTALYDRYDRMPEMRKALFAWGEKVEAIVTRRDKKVVRIG